MKTSVLFILLALFASCVSAQTFRLASPTDVSDIAYVADPVRQAYASLGHQVAIVYMPAKRALLESSTNSKIDGELGRIKLAKEYLPNLLRIPVPIFTARLVALTKQKEFSVQQISDLGAYRLAAIRGIIYSDIMLRDLDTQFLNDVPQSIAMLLRDRVDVVIIPDLMIQSLMTTAEFEHFSVYPLPIEEMKIYHYVHRKHIEMVPVLTEALSKITGIPVEKE